MPGDAIYLDHHATTPCDPVVVDAMRPYFTEAFGNPHSTTHLVGRAAAEAVDGALERIAGHLGGTADEWVVTSGATESNNLALQGVLLHPRCKGRHVVTLATEHPSVLDPLAHLERNGIAVTRLPVLPDGRPDAGRVDLNRFTDALRDDTALVTVMLANGEIGALQPLAEIAAICRSRGIPLHTDAAQAVGRIPVDVDALDVDLLSCSGHKIYGPKGVGLLYVRRRGRRVRLRPLLYGGGQQGGLRPGTVNPAAVVALGAAVDRCAALAESEPARLAALRDRLWESLHEALPEVALNGPSLSDELRLPGNLNVRFSGVEGETLMMQCPEIAVSSGSACSSADSAPSHVLLALGMSEADARSSLRFGLGRFTTPEEITRAADRLIAAYRALRSLA